MALAACAQHICCLNHAPSHHQPRRKVRRSFITGCDHPAKTCFLAVTAARVVHMHKARVLRLLRQPSFGHCRSKACKKTTKNDFQCAAAVARAVAADQLQYWDVIEYKSPTAEPHSRRLGLVQQVTADVVQVSPLVEEDEGVWIPDEQTEQHEVSAGCVLQIVDHVYGQRQDQEHNPHGEHAHDVWQVVIPIPREVYRGSLRLRK